MSPEKEEMMQEFVHQIEELMNRVQQVEARAGQAEQTAEAQYFKV